MTSSLTYFLSAVFGILAVVLLLWRPGPKWWIGVRLPWTFADRQIWDTSWVMAGLFCLAIAVVVLYSPLAFYLALALFFILYVVTGKNMARWNSGKMSGGPVTGRWCAAAIAVIYKSSGMKRNYRQPSARLAGWSAAADKLRSG
jgi:hypothetical protein